MSETRVLNLYAGIGGNRKLWEDVDVVAVEWDENIASVYQDHFPGDEVVVADAHDFLQSHYNDGWDFIWASPPCQTHSRVSYMGWKSNEKHNAPREPEYPDMRLYQEIIFLEYFAECDWVVENVQPYYNGQRPLIDAQYAGRHFFWSNFPIPLADDTGLSAWKGHTLDDFEEAYGFDLSNADLGSSRKDQVLNNCVNPELGKHVFDAATTNRQLTLTDTHS